MVIVIGLALALILAGLLMAFLSGSMKYPAMVAVVFWVGVALVVVGLVLLLAPVVAWLNYQFRAMLGA